MDFKDKHTILLYSSILIVVITLLFISFLKVVVCGGFLSFVLLYKDIDTKPDNINQTTIKTDKKGKTKTTEKITTYN